LRNSGIHEEQPQKKTEPKGRPGLFVGIDFAVTAFQGMLVIDYLLTFFSRSIILITPLFLLA
jgi:hypothetical protein